MKALHRYSGATGGEGVDAFSRLPNVTVMHRRAAESRTAEQRLLFLYWVGVMWRKWRDCRQQMRRVFHKTNPSVGNCSSQFGPCFQLNVRFRMWKYHVTDFMKAGLTESISKERDGMKCYSSAAI